MTEFATSKNGIPIRLTFERWTHISEEHNELAGLRLEVLETVGQPDRVVAGLQGALLAVREIESEAWLVAVYRETGGDDGFVITAFVTHKRRFLERREQLWP